MRYGIIENINRQNIRFAITQIVSMSSTGVIQFHIGFPSIPIPVNKTTIVKKASKEAQAK